MSIRTLSPEETVSLFLEGKEAWNSFMEEHENVDVSFKGKILFDDFTELIFKGYADFSDAVFEELVDFSNSIFDGVVDFSNTQFQHAAIFENVTFKGQANYSYSSFKGIAHFKNSLFSSIAEFNSVYYSNRADFDYADFKEEAFFDESQFKSVVSFRAVSFSSPCYFNKSKFESEAFFSYSNFYDVFFDDCSFKKSPLFVKAIFMKTPSLLEIHSSSDFVIGLDFNYRVSNTKKWWEINKADDFNDCLRYRVIKQHAINAKDHEMELKCFAWEMMAKRWYIVKDPISICLSFLYQWFSYFGYSTVRPIFWLFVLCNMCSFSYYNIANNPSYLNSFIYTLSNVLPFGNLGKFSSEFHKSLFTHDLPWVGIDAYQFYITLVMNGLFGFIFVFLIGLSLRNRFRL